MSAIRWFAVLILLAGCAGPNDKGPVASQSKKQEAAPTDTAAIQANLAKLSDEDREAAQTQKFCAVHGDSRLGSMGVPVTIALKDKDGTKVTVFLCCEGCEKAARADEAKTAAAAAELNIAGNLAALSPEDRALAQAQKFCAVTTDSRLGSMGPPEKYIIKGKDGDHPVFVCCGGCIREIKKDEAKTLRDVEELKKKNAEAK